MAGRTYGRARRGQHGSSAGGVLGGALTAVAVAGLAAVLYPPARRRVGRSLHAAVERWLSGMVGADVRFGHAGFSPLTGEFELTGVTVRRTPSAEPLVSVERVRGLVHRRALLGGELALDAVEVERPRVSVVRRAGGSATNLPPGLEAGPGELARKAGRAMESAEGVARTAGRLGLCVRVGKAFLVGGEVRFRDESVPGGYEVGAERVSGRLAASAHGGGYDFYGVAPRLARRDERGDLGEVMFYGQLRQGGDGGDLTDFPRSGLWAEMEASGPERVRARVDCPSVESRQVRVRVEGEAELAALAPLVPPGVPVLEPLRSAGTRGRVDFRLAATYDPARGLRIPEMNQAAHGVTVGGTGAAGRGY